MPNFLISPKDIYSAIDDNGNPLVGGELFTYIAGSNTPIPTYTDATGSVENTNPVILDSRGEAPVWLNDEMVYKFVLRQPASEGGAIIRTTDNIRANNGGGGVGLSYVSHSDSETISIDGLGTASSPLTANVLISSISANALGITTGGLYVADMSEAIADKLDKVQTDAQSVVSEVTLKEGLILGDSKWIKPETPQSPIFLTNGTNPSGLNTTVQLYQDTLVLTSGDGTTQSGEVGIGGSQGIFFNEPNGKYEFKNTPDGTPVKGYGKDSNDELIQYDVTDDGENNTSSNSGTGVGLALPKVGVDLPFQSLAGSGGTSITTDGETVTIDSTTTSAGLVTDIYFRGDQNTITAGTFYNVSEEGRGTLSATQQITVSDNQKSYFTQDYITDPYDADATVKRGSYKAEATIQASSNSALIKFTIEVYTCDNDGVPYASGVTGAPIGDLGVQVLAIMQSAELGIDGNDPTQINLSSFLEENVDVSMDDRIRFHVSGEKIGTQGGNKTLQFISGAIANTYVEIPAQINTNDVLDLSTVTSLGTQTEANNTLNTNKLDKVDATAQSVVSKVDFDGGVKIGGGYYGASSPQLFLSNDESSFLFDNGTLFNTQKTFSNGSFSALSFEEGVNGSSSVLGVGQTTAYSRISQTSGSSLDASSMDFELYNPLAGGVDAFNFTGAKAVFNSGVETTELLNVPTDTLAYTYGENASGNLAKSLGGGGGSQDLQSVTDVGNVTTNGATFGKSVSSRFRLQNYIGDGTNKRLTMKYDANDSIPGIYAWDEDLSSLIGLYLGGFNDTNYNMKLDTDRNVAFGGRILQGSVTDDGTTGIIGTSAKFTGGISASSFLGTSGNTSLNAIYRNSSSNAFYVKQQGSGDVQIWEKGVGSVGVPSDKIASIANNGTFTTIGNIAGLNGTFSGGLTVSSIPTGTQVGLVGYDSNGKLIQGVAGGGGVTPTAWVNASLNSSLGFRSSMRPLRYRGDGIDGVQIEGSCKYNTSLALFPGFSVVLFTLPIGSRPNKDVNFTVQVGYNGSVPQIEAWASLNSSNGQVTLKNSDSVAISELYDITINTRFSLI